MTRSTPLLLAVVTAVAAPGCASRARVRSQQAEIDALKTQIAQMSKDQRDLRAQNESMRNEMFILHDRVETARTALARQPAAPAPKLEVVKLKPSEADPLAAKVVHARPASPDPVDAEGYDPSADEAEMFSVSDDTSSVSVSPIPEMGMSAATAPKAGKKAPSTKPVAIASVASSVPAATEPLAVPAPAPAKEKSGPKEDPMKLYQRAFADFQAKNFEESQLLFQQFVNENPAHEYADNAYYWMGEIYYTQGEYSLALDEFQKVPELYPGGNKVPDALLKLGLCYQGLNDVKNAAKTLKQLVDAYPQSAAAEKGRQKLAALEKH
ncbi:MAG TPA: tol-pal system protein YbgF [bacterium]|nr:tol-pal system protein YbgF [bacterium]